MFGHEIMLSKLKDIKYKVKLYPMIYHIQTWRPGTREKQHQ